MRKASGARTPTCDAVQALLVHAATGNVANARGYQQWDVGMLVRTRLLGQRDADDVQRFGLRHNGPLAVHLELRAQVAILAEPRAHTTIH